MYAPIYICINTVIESVGVLLKNEYIINVRAVRILFYEFFHVGCKRKKQAEGR